MKKMKRNSKREGYLRKKKEKEKENRKKSSKLDTTGEKKKEIGQLGKAERK